MLGDDPKQNTLAQKSWLYVDDAAVNYKINGFPKAIPVTDRSLVLPSDINTEVPPIHWNHHRKAVLTGKKFYFQRRKYLFR
jgi:hypothetical protein